LSSEIEKQVIESVLKKNEVFYSLGLSKAHFQTTQHRQVYAVIADMLDRRLEVNIATLNAEAPSLSPSRLAEYDPVTAANVGYYANQLKERKRKRDLNAVLKDLLHQSESGGDTSSIIDDGTAQMLGVNTNAVNRLVKVKTLVHPMLERLESQGKHGEQEGIVTEYYELDEMLGGLRAGELMILAARPSIGKTTFAINIAANMARAGKSVGFFSLEMTEADIMLRLVASEGRIGHQVLRSALFTPADFLSISIASERIYEWDLWLDDTPRIMFSDLRNKARMLKTYGVEILFVDYLTLIKYGDSRVPRPERVGELSAELKALAAELEIPIVALSQVNREGEGQKPTLAHLRQSGEIEENADIVVFLHRANREIEDTEVIVAKHRNGPAGTCNLYMNLIYLKFEDAVKR